MSGEPSSGGEAAGPDAAELRGALGVPLSDALLERALTHRSYAYENGGLPTNERLEFLGDSVLGLVVTDTLYNEHPDLQEGQLAKLRAAVVNMRALAGVARTLSLGRHIMLGRGEEGTGGRDKSSILADTLEAIIGAVYLDCGLDEAASLVHRLFDSVIARSARLGAGLDWKTSLQELTASQMLGVPDYAVQESGPDHQKSFRAVVRVGGQPYGSGVGRSKKEAEQQAAEVAWTAIRENSIRAAAQSADAASPADDEDGDAAGDAPPADDAASSAERAGAGDAQSAGAASLAGVDDGAGMDGRDVGGGPRAGTPGGPGPAPAGAELGAPAAAELSAGAELSAAAAGDCDGVRHGDARGGESGGQ